jgi:hypothetical protein
MKRVMLTAVVAVCLFGNSNTGVAQFTKGENYLGAHLGLSGVGSAFTFGADYERGVTDKMGPGTIGVGAMVDYWTYSFNYPFALGDFSYNYVSIGFTGNYHFILDDHRWDPFAGLVLGYYVVNVSTPAGNYTGFEGSRAYLGLVGGIRYAFTPRLDGQARLGFGPYILAVGVDFKI